MLDSQATISELENQQRDISERLQQRRREEYEELLERAAKIGYTLIPIEKAPRKRGRKPRQQQEQQ